MSGLRPSMASDVRELISNLTGFDPEEENFVLCYDFASSNLLYNNCLDPEEKSLEKTLKGLGEKFLIHAEREKAAALEKLLSEYNSSAVFQEPHPQFDIKIRLLSLLLHLSERPLTAKWEKTKEPSEEKEKEGLDWRKILMEGEELWRPGSESDLSEWSSEENLDESEQLSRQNNFLDEAGPKQKIDAKSSTDQILAVLQGETQPQYWKSIRCNPNVESSSVSATFVNKVDFLTRQAGINTTIKLHLSEYQLLRECLWMLRNPVESTVFHSSHHCFKVNPNVCIPSVTAETLTSALSDFCITIGKLRQLMDFCNFVFSEQKRIESNIPYTYEAYGSALSTVLQSFSNHVLRLEEVIYRQAETFTLLEFLSNLSAWAGIIDFLYDGHNTSVETRKAENWEKAIKLISGLYQSLTSVSRQDSCDIMLNLFLKTCKPYFRMLDLWLSEGKLEDFRDEFVFTSNKAREDETFWDSGVLIRPYKEFLNESNLTLPALFEITFDKVLVSGKSIEILAILEKQSKKSYDSSSISVELFDAFLESIRKELSSSDKPDLAAPVSLRPTRSISQNFDHNNLDMDPYLVLAFAEIAETVDALVDEQEDPSFLSTSADPLRPIALVFNRCLTPLIESFYVSSSRSLLNLVTVTLNLQHHFGAVRRVFLMEAGDLLYEFYTDIFRRLEDDRSSLDSTSVTLFLQDCIARRHSEDADRFAMRLPDENFQDLESSEVLNNAILTYEVDWPLSIVLNAESLAMYNKIFLFLLQVKRSLWALQQIHAHSLLQKVEKGEEEDEDCDSEETIDLRVVTHRILLLRSWLFHFVGNVHSYFMTRVLHSTELELKNSLSECEDFDQVMQSHQQYLTRIYDRCFFHPSARVLREAVLKVLKLCHGLHELCQSAKWDMEKLEAMEENYVKSHEFLASTLSSMTQKLNVPHLDGLAAALVYSSPTKAI